jgi:hypothetical protein
MSDFLMNTYWESIELVDKVRDPSLSEETFDEMFDKLYEVLSQYEKDTITYRQVSIDSL